MENLINTLNQVSGRTDLEITIRGERQFTFSFYEIDKVATRKICDFFKGQAKVTVEEDAECGTFIYCNV